MISYRMFSHVKHGRYLLRDFLQLDEPPPRDESITKFAARSGLDRIWLQRFLKHGLPARVATADAWKIEDATGGKVPMDSMVETTPDELLEAYEADQAEAS